MLRSVPRFFLLVRTSAFTQVKMFWHLARPESVSTPRSGLLWPTFCDANPPFAELRPRACSIVSEECFPQSRPPAGETSRFLSYDADSPDATGGFPFPLFQFLVVLFNNPLVANASRGLLLRVDACFDRRSRPPLRSLCEEIGGSSSFLRHR